jgi:hypothetical protein
MPVSIKHGTGLCGVRWHYRIIEGSVLDKDMDWLRARTRPESFEFYSQWHTQHR